MKKSVLTVLSVLLPILASAQAKPDTLFFVNGEKAIASISKMSSEDVEYVYPNESLVNVAKTAQLKEIRLGSGRVISYSSNTSSSFLDKTVALDAIPAEKSPWQDLSVLADVMNLNLVLDFSEATILHRDVSDFIATEPDWDTGIAEVEGRFMSTFNEGANWGSTPHKAGHYSDAEYTLVIKVTSVEDKGSEISGYVCIIDAVKQIVFSRDFNTEAGRYGSVLNLMGDAMEEFGDDLGDTFGKYAKTPSLPKKESPVRNKKK